MKKPIETSTNDEAREPIPTPHLPYLGDGYLVVLDSSGDSNQNLQTHDQLGLELGTSRLHHSAGNRQSSSIINTASVGVGAGSLDTTYDTQQVYVDTRGSNVAQCMLIESNINRVRTAGTHTVIYDTSRSLFGQPGYTQEKYIDIRTCNAGQPTNSENHHEIISENFHEQPIRVINTDRNIFIYNTHETNDCSNVYETIE